MKKRPSHGVGPAALLAGAIIITSAGCATLSADSRLFARLLKNAPTACVNDSKQDIPPTIGPGFLKLLKAELVVCPEGAVARLFKDDGEAASILCPGRRTSVRISDKDTGCMPAFLSTVDTRAAKLTAAAMTELAAGHAARGLKLAKKADGIQKDSEMILVILATAFSANRDFENAEKTLARALKTNPGDFRLRLARAATISELGDKDGYAKEILKLFDEVPKTDPLHFELVCRLADNENRIGNRDRAIRMARTACENGVKLCCGLAASDVEAVEVIPSTPDSPTKDQGSR